MYIRENLISKANSAPKPRSLARIKNTESLRTISKQIGYARVNTTHQATDRQVAALKDADCEVVYNEVISTRTSEGDRPQLQACLASLNEGDELVITTLSRLGRTQHEVINRLHD